jgi:hypothetical protein
MTLHDFPAVSILTGNTLAKLTFKDGEHLRIGGDFVANLRFSI